MSEWREIESAPKDGRVVLAWESFVDHVLIQYREGGWVWAKDFSAYDPPPTHWMPLPDPPSR